MINLIKKLNAWTTKQIEMDLIKKHGGIQWCPWCNQCMQKYEDTSFKIYEQNPFYDEITCGNCYGSSLWSFEFGMSFYKTLKQPIGIEDEIT